jgi:uncharacterized protein YdgA (DUF945 family)
MSRKVVLAGVVTGVLGVYTGASWFCGHLVNESFESWQQNSQSKLPPFIVLERHHTAGIFRSSQDITIQFDASDLDKLWRGAPPVQEASERADSTDPSIAVLKAAWQHANTEQSSQPLKVTLRNEIAHGPLPRFTSVGLAHIQSRLALSESAKKTLGEAIGDKDPVSVSTQLAFMGSGVTEIESPAFKFTHRDATISWQGVQGRLAFGRDLDTLECATKAPGLKVHSDDAVIALGELSMSCDLQKIFKELYAGTMQFDVAGMDGTFKKDGVPTRFKMGRAGYAFHVTRAGDYVDVIAKVDMARLEAPDVALSDVAYHLTFKHIHGPTYAALTKKLQSQPLWTMNDPAGAASMMGAFSEFGPTLLEHNPELVIDRIAFTLPEGTASLSAKVKLVGYTREDAAGLGAMSKLEAVADVSVAEALVHKDWNTGAEAAEADTGSPTGSRVEMLREQATQMEQQGFITRRDGQYESHVEFKRGALTVNGKPLH